MSQAPDHKVAIFAFWDTYLRPKATEFLTEVIRNRFFWHYQDDAVYEPNTHPYIPLSRLELAVKNAWITTVNKLQSNIIIDPTFIDGWIDWSLIRHLVQCDYEKEVHERELNKKKRRLEQELKECERALKRARKE